MANTRDVKSGENQGNRSEGLKSFTDLAHSQPEFNSVGMMWHIKEHPLSEAVITLASSTITTSTLKSEGSGVYIGNRIVITAAHCIPESIKNGQFIGNSSQNFYFFTRDKDNKKLGGIRIIRAERHPAYKYKEDTQGLATRGKQMSTDIGVLLLAGTPPYADTVEVDYDFFSIKNNCISVGFPHLFIPRRSDNERVYSDSPIKFLREKIAVKMLNTIYYLIVQPLWCEHHYR